MRPIERILVGVDFTDASQSALNEAALLARTLGAELQLLHALPDVPAASVGFDDRCAVEHAERLLERAARDLTDDAGVRVQRPVLVVAGKGAADALLAAIAERQPDLVVIGAGRKTALDRLLVGSTAEHVVRGSPRPVWLSRPAGDHDTLRRILCAVDASEPAREALGVAAFLARTFVARLDTVSVRSTGPIKPTETADALRKIDLHGIDQRLTVRTGEPAEQILEAVEELGADVLVLGSAGRTGLSRLLRGNTAEKVLRRVSCSLLVVPKDGVAV